MNKIVTVFPETHLGLGHLGLGLLAKKRRLDVKALEPGQFVLFLNRAQTAFKLFCASNTVVYYKHARGRLSMEAIQHFPSVFEAGEFSYDKALEKVLAKEGWRTR